MEVWSELDDRRLARFSLPTPRGRSMNLAYTLAFLEDLEYLGACLTASVGVWLTKVKLHGIA